MSFNLFDPNEVLKDFKGMGMQQSPQSSSPDLSSSNPLSLEDLNATQNYIDNSRQQLNSQYDYNPFNAKSVISDFQSRYGRPQQSQQEYFAQQNANTIKGLQQNLDNGGIDVPVEEPKVGFLTKVGNRLSTLLYPVAGAINNAVSDDPNKHWYEGVKEGLNSAWTDKEGGNITFKDVLNTLLTSTSEDKRAVGDVVTNTLNVVNPWAWKDISKEGLTHDLALKHHDFAGFLGDMVADPLMYLGGVGEAGKVLGKGSEALKASNAGIGKLTDAYEALNKLGLVSDVKNTKALYNKTAELLGYMPNYKGITFAGHTIPGLSAENIGKVADSSIGKVLGIPFDAVNKVGTALKDSKLGEGVSDLFGRGKYNALIRDAIKHPDSALNQVAFADYLKRSENLKKLAMEGIVDKAKELQTQIGDKNNDVLKQMEVSDTLVQKEFGVKEVDKLNPVFEEEMNNRLTILQSEYDDTQRELQHINNNTHGADMEALARYKQLMEHKELLDNIPTLESVEFDAQLRNAGIKLENATMQRISNESDVLLNPMVARTATHEELTAMLQSIADKGGEFGDVSELALRLKKASDNTIDTIEKKYPTLSKFYEGSFVKNKQDVIDRGMSSQLEGDVAKSAHETMDYKLNMHSKDTEDIGYPELVRHRQILQERLKTINPSNTKVIEKMKEDIANVDKELAVRKPVEELKLDTKIRESIKNNEDLSRPSKEVSGELTDNIDRQQVNITKVPDSILQKTLQPDKFEMYKKTGNLNHLSKYEKNNLERIQFHYDNLAKKGFYHESLEKMSPGTIINKSKEFLNPDLGNLLKDVPTPTGKANQLINEETYKKAVKEAKDITEKNVNPYTGKEISSLEEYNMAKDEFLRRHSMQHNGNVQELGYQSAMLKEGGSATPEVAKRTDEQIVDNTAFETDKFAHLKEQEAQQSVRGQKLIDFNKPGNKRTLEEIQKVYPDIDANSLRFMSEKDLNKFMNDVKRGKLTDKDIKAIMDIHDILGAEGKGKGIVENLNKDAEFMHFNTPNGNLFAETTAKPEAVNHMGDTILNRPEELSHVNDGTNVTMVNGSIGKGANGGELKGTFDNTTKKDITLTDRTTPNELTGTINHETAHAFGNNAWHADRTASSIVRDMSNWTPDMMKQADDLFRKVGRQLGDSSKHITTYLDQMAKSGAKKGVMNQETLAELGSIFLHNDPVIRQEAQRLFPEGSKKMLDLVSKLPDKQLKELVPKGSPIATEIEAKLNGMKEVAKVFEDTNVTNMVKAKQMEGRIKELENLFSSHEAYKKWFKEQYPEYPEFIKVMEPIKDTVNILSAFNSLPEGARQAAIFMREQLKRAGVEEGIVKEDLDELYHYFPHVLNWDLKQDKKATSLFSKGLQDPANMNAKERKIQGTIEQINKEMKAKHGIDNFFETNVVRAYTERMLSHENFMFKKDLVDRSLDLFGTRIDKGMYQTLPPKERTAYFEKIQDMIKSGDYNVVRAQDKYEEVMKNTVSDSTLENAKLNQSPYHAYVEIDPKEITEETLFKNREQNVYLVKKDTHKILNDVAGGQFKQMNNALLKMYDKFNNMWKASALFSVSFNFNNIIGNTFNSYLGVGAKILNPKLNAMSAMINTGRGYGEFMGKTGEEWQRIAKEYGVIDSGFVNTDLKDFREGLTDKLEGNPLKKLSLNPFSNKFAPGVGAQHIASKIESQARMTNFLAHIENGKSYQEASDLVNKFLFDYSDLTDFEHNVVKRIVPFYTWMRKNIPLQLENMYKQPQKYDRILRGTQDASKDETPEQKTYKPDYLSNAIHLGNGKYVDPRLPMEDLDRFKSLGDLFGSVTPLIKVPIEEMENKNTFMDTPIANQPRDKVKAPLYLKPFATDTPKGSMIDAKVAYALKNLLPAVEQVSNSVQAYTDPNMSQASRDKADAFTGVHGGVRVYSIDPEKQKQQAIEDYIKKLQGIESNAKEQGYVEKTAEQLMTKQEKEANALKSLAYQQKLQKAYEQNQINYQEYKRKLEEYKNKTGYKPSTSSSALSKLLSQVKPN